VRQLGAIAMGEKGSPQKFDNHEEEFMQMLRYGLVSVAVGLTAPFFANSAFAQAATQLKVGMLATMSGGGASYGIAQCRGWKMAAEDINKRGGVTAGGRKYTFDAVCEDDKVNAAEATAAANKLISRDKATFLGMYSSASVMAAAPLTTEKKIFTASAAGVRQALGPDKPYNFRTYMTPNEVGGILWDWVKKNRPNIKRVAMITRDDAIGQSLAKDMKDILTSKGFEVVSVEFAGLATSDFYPVLTRILGQKPDAIELGSMNPAGIGLIAKQTAELGWKGPLFNTGEAPVIDTLKIGGPDNVVGRYFATTPDYDSQVATPAERELSARYRKEFNEPLSGLTTMAYNGLTLIAQAMQGSSSIDAEAMTKWVQANDIQTMHGTSKLGGKAIYGVPNQLYTPVWISEATPTGWKAITKAPAVLP
jgi:branched-chain amino acid transport system substrate-binding protein